MSGPVLIHGRAAEVLSGLEAASVDMVYSDPPFGNEKVWTAAAGSFDDRWTWNEEASCGWAALRSHNPRGADLVALIADDENARSYLGVMAGILVGVRHVLKPTGSLWLHADDTFTAELRILGDAVFGVRQHFGVVIWKRTSAHGNSSKAFGRVHDSIACFGRSSAAKWRLARCKSPMVYGDPCEGIRVDDVITDVRLNSRAAERVQYPTQKPVALIERFVEAATLPGDTVLDPTCGSGTTLVAALGLGRRAIGIDASADAIAVATKRLDLRAPVQTDLFGRAA